MIFAALTLSAALTIQATPPDLSWMAGSWLTCEGGRETSETWSDAGPGLLVGHGVTLGRGRASFDLFHIAMTEAGPVYFAQPGGEPPTPFTATEIRDNRVVFADPEHDFPQRVIYQRDGDAMTARIEGDVGGQSRSVEWRYQKATLNMHCPT